MKQFKEERNVNTVVSVQRHRNKPNNARALFTKENLGKFIDNLIIIKLPRILFESFSNMIRQDLSAHLAVPELVLDFKRQDRQILIVEVALQILGQLLS